MTGRGREESQRRARGRPARRHRARPRQGGDRRAPPDGPEDAPEDAPEGGPEGDPGDGAGAKVATDDRVAGCARFSRCTPVSCYSGDVDLEAVWRRCAAPPSRRRRRSSRSGAETVAERDGERMAACAEAMAEAFPGARLFAFGNGGSSTDAQDVAALFLNPGWRLGRCRRSRSPRDVAVVTALANDIGFEVVFARQLAASGRARRHRVRPVDERQLRATSSPPSRRRTGEE